MKQLMMAVADHAEYRQGYKPGELLLLEMMKFYGQPPEWFVGKDLYTLHELMVLDNVRDVAGRMGRDPKSITVEEMAFYKVLEKWREDDVFPDGSPRYHGKVGAVEEEMPFEMRDEEDALE